MFTKFFNIDSEKQDRILNAAMHEFARSGFARASTNEIVKEADISKGLLFHYFSNKKTLYLYLFDHCIELTSKQFYDNLDLNEPDFFRRLRQISFLKLNLYKQYPAMFQFFESAYVETSSEVINELAIRLKDLSDVGYAKIFGGIDLTPFKEEEDLHKLIKIIQWTLECFRNEELERARVQAVPIDFDRLKSEADDYITLFKKYFYK